MLFLPDDAVTESEYRDGYTVDIDFVMDRLIEEYDKKSVSTFSDALRHVRRAHNIRTTDLVGNQRMIGARVTYIDNDGTPHRGICLEPEVESLGTSPVYDPNKDEMVDPSQYPLGTIQLIRGDGWEFGTDTGFFDRVQSDTKGRGLRAETSVTPGTGLDDTHCYFAGWGFFDEHADE